MAAAVPMGAVLTTAFPGAGGSQKRVRPQRAHFYPSCFFDVLRLSSVLLCLSSKAKETRANYLSFFTFIFPPRDFLQSCVAPEVVATKIKTFILVVLLVSFVHLSLTQFVPNPKDLLVLWITLWNRAGTVRGSNSRVELKIRTKVRRRNRQNKPTPRF